MPHNVAKLDRDPGGWVSLGMSVLCLQAADDHLHQLIQRAQDPWTKLALMARGV
jgi:hypothetical protein